MPAAGNSDPFVDPTPPPPPEQPTTQPMDTSTAMSDEKAQVSREGNLSSIIKGIMTFSPYVIMSHCMK